MTDPASVRAALDTIWKEVLGDAYTSGTHDTPFFEFGGSSIQLLELSRRITATFEVKFPLRQLFEYSTLEQQVTLVGKSGAAGTDVRRRRRAVPGRSFPGTGRWCRSRR